MDLEHEKRLSSVEARAKSNTRRLDAVEARQDDLDKLTSSVAALATKQEDMDGDVKEIKADVKALNAKPGKRWESIVDKAIWAVLAAVIAFLLARVGL